MRVVRLAKSSRAGALVSVLFIALLGSCGGDGDETPPSPPATVATFSVYPKYVIGSVIYMPPGPGSYIEIGNGVVTGTTVSTASSWGGGASAGTHTGFVGFGGMPIVNPFVFGNGFGGASAGSVDMQILTKLDFWAESRKYIVPASAPEAIDHDWDQIVIYMGMRVNASVDALGHVSWGMDFSSVPSNGFAMSGYSVLVGCLRPSTVPAEMCAGTLRVLSDAGITQADYPDILSAHPFADPSASLIPDPRRYVFLDWDPYDPSAGVSRVKRYRGNSSSAVNTELFAHGYSVGATVSGAYVAGTLVDPTRFTWTSASTSSNLTGSTYPNVISYAMPSPGYSGPTRVFVYLDTIYKTLMFSFHPPQR